MFGSWIDWLWVAFGQVGNALGFLSVKTSGVNALCLHDEDRKGSRAPDRLV